MPKILFFPYFGPNRRSHHRVVEIRLDFDPDEAPELQRHVSRARPLLKDTGIPDNDTAFMDMAPGSDWMSWYAGLFAQTSVLLQRQAGHRVSYHCVLEGEKQNQRIALAQHEHSQVGMEATKLTVRLLRGNLKTLQEEYSSFIARAGEYVLPIETEAIILRARELGIPVFQADREPLSESIKPVSHARPNGLLILGHGQASHFFDGTFCIDRAGEYQKALLRNPDQRNALLRQMGIPLARKKYGKAPDHKRYFALVVNRKTTFVERSENGHMHLVDNVHGSITKLCDDISERMTWAPIAIHLSAGDVTQPLSSTGGTVVDFDLAPDLGQLLGSLDEGPGLLKQVTGELINWLFPDPATARMPIIAVTGTNGKTTTVRMINHILQVAGHKPGLVCTDGIFINGKQISNTDAGTFIGHARALTNKAVDAAVLEAHHRGITIRGFAFDDCEVAVCLNVTEDHLAKGEIETIEEMAAIKRALLEQTSQNAVLFADDGHCMAMLDFVKAEKVCLVSLNSSAKQLGKLSKSKAACFCVLESIKEESWVVIHDGEQSLPLIPITRIPATFGGAAGFNVSNAMHAIAATYLFGTNTRVINTALQTFEAGQKMTPGRLNELHDLPFRVIIDFAHNPDGVNKVCEFIDQQPVTGRKLVAFAGMAKRPKETNRKIAQAVAGHFNFYFCKEHHPSKPPIAGYMAGFMQQVLVEEGVPASDTTVLKYGRDHMYQIFDACKPGDLLLLLLGHVEIHTVPGYIKDYAALKHGTQDK